MFPAWNGNCKTLSVPEELQTLPMPGPDLGSERRAKARVALKCAVQVFRPGRDSLPKCVTQDISSTGFYFFSSEDFVPGEQFRCFLEMPAQAGGAAEDRLGLECRAEVIRVEELGQGKGLGVACRIADYRVVHFAADVSVPVGAHSH